MHEVLLNEAQQRLQATLREMVRADIMPRVAEIERDEALPADLVQKLLAPPWRLPALAVPKEYGGLGLDELSVCVVCEEVAYGYASLIPFIEVSQLAGNAIALAGDAEQKRRYLTALAEGEMFGYALTDEGAGSDPGAMRSTATARGKGYVLNGRKRYITYADLASRLVTFARTDQGVTSFVVAKSDHLVLERRVKSMGLRGHTAFDLRFNDLPAESMLGASGEGMRLALRVLERTRVSLACGFVGLARAAFDAAAAFAKEREIGKHKLASYQTIAFSLVELATHIEAARLLAYRAALLCERDKPDRRATSMAKWYAGDVLVRAVTTASRVLGGFGARTDYPVERYLRDAFAWVPAQGTNEVQKLVISRELFT